MSVYMDICVKSCQFKKSSQNILDPVELYGNVMHLVQQNNFHYNINKN